MEYRFLGFCLLFCGPVACSLVACDLAGSLPDGHGKGERASLALPFADGFSPRGACPQLDKQGVTSFVDHGYAVVDLPPRFRDATTLHEMTKRVWTYLDGCFLRWDSGELILQEECQQGTAVSPVEMRYPDKIRSYEVKRYSQLEAMIELETKSFGPPIHETFTFRRDHPAFSEMETWAQDYQQWVDCMVEGLRPRRENASGEWVPVAYKHSQMSFDLSPRDRKRIFFAYPQNPRAIIRDPGNPEVPVRADVFVASLLPLRNSTLWFFDNAEPAEEAAEGRALSGATDGRVVPHYFFPPRPPGLIERVPEEIEGKNEWRPLPQGKLLIARGDLPYVFAGGPKSEDTQARAEPEEDPVVEEMHTLHFMEDVSPYFDEPNGCDSETEAVFSGSEAP